MQAPSSNIHNSLVIAQNSNFFCKQAICVSYWIQMCVCEQMDKKSVHDNSSTGWRWSQMAYILTTTNFAYTHQVHCVKDLNLSSLVAARKGKEAVFIGNGQSNKACGIDRCVTNVVQHLHVSNIMDVKTLFETHHQTLLTKANICTHFHAKLTG